MFGRLFRRLYDANCDVISGPAERAGLSRQRHELLTSANGAKMPFPYPLVGCHPTRDTLREIKASPNAIWKSVIALLDAGSGVTRR